MNILEQIAAKAEKGDTGMYYIMGFFILVWLDWKVKKF